MLPEKGDNNMSDHSPAIRSPPHKRPRLLRLLDYKPKDMDEFKSEAGEIVELKDYIEWYNSIAAKDKEFALEFPFLSARSYGRWYTTSEMEAKKNFMNPWDYTHWLMSRFDPNYGINKWALLAEKKAKLALAYMKMMNTDQDYEYVKHKHMVKCRFSFHLNFYARPKVISPLSSVPQQPGLDQLFFAEVDFREKVLDCSILDSQDFGEGRTRIMILHPPHNNCEYCNGDEDELAFS